jgi:hypothetical protein
MLTDLYAVVAHLSDLSYDRRNAAAAKSVVATWYECQQNSGLGPTMKPPFVSDLEERLAEYDDMNQTLDHRDPTEGQTPTPFPQLWDNEGVEGYLQPFDFSFAEIDWSFWENMS